MGKARVKRFAGIPEVETKVEKKAGIHAVPQDLKVFFQASVLEDAAVPGVVVAIQSFGDFLGYNPHLHVLCSDRCFYGNGMFRVAPRFETKQLEKIFRHKAFPAMRVRT